jgi:hypothetical protein
MERPDCSFCDAYIGPLLASTLSTTDDSCLREHAAGCPNCAARVSAAQRLGARWAPMNVGDALVSQRPAAPTDDRRAPVRPPRRKIVVASLGVFTAFVMLTSNLDPLLGSPGLPEEGAGSDACLLSELGRADAAQLAACGSPIPAELIPSPITEGTADPGEGPGGRADVLSHAWVP